MPMENTGARRKMLENGSALVSERGFSKLAFWGRGSSNSPDFCEEAKTLKKKKKKYFAFLGQF